MTSIQLPSIITPGGPIGSATVAPIVTYDAKGRLTVVSSAAIVPDATAAVRNQHTLTAHGFVIGDVIAVFPPSAAALLSADSFNRADNATSLGSTDGAGSADPKTWLYQLGNNVGIQSNRAYRSTVSNDTAYIDVVNPNHSVKITLAVIGGNNFGIIARFSDFTHYWLMDIVNGFGVNLYKINGSATVSLGQFNRTFTAGDTITLSCGGNTIQIYHNTTLLGTVTDSFNNTATKAGIEFSDGGYRADNWQVNVVPTGGGGLIKAKADNVQNAEAIGVVSSVLDANNFVVTQVGKISGLVGLIPGAVYYLSNLTAGVVSTTQPSGSGTVNKPIYLALDTTTAYVLNYRAVVNP